MLTRMLSSLVLLIGLSSCAGDSSHSQLSEISHIAQAIEIQPNSTALIEQVTHVTIHDGHSMKGLLKTFPSRNKNGKGIALEVLFAKRKRPEDKVLMDVHYKALNTGYDNILQLGDGTEELGPGLYTYHLLYRVKNLITEEDLTDQVVAKTIDWNVTGTHWGMPIRNVTTEIRYPRFVEKGHIAHAASIGLLPDDIGLLETRVDKAVVHQIAPDARDPEVMHLKYITNQTIAPKQGFAIRTTWKEPKPRRIPTPMASYSD